MAQESGSTSVITVVGRSPTTVKPPAEAPEMGPKRKLPPPGADNKCRVTEKKEVI